MNSPQADATKFGHAVVIGGSMAGLMAARVLSNHFARVTILERDKVNDMPEARKGQPQTQHLHGLLARGLEIMSAYFPELPAALVANGAIISDMGRTMRWYSHGGYRIQFESGLSGALMSRPLLEWQLRRLLLALPNVAIWDECAVVEPVTNAEKSALAGVRVIRRNLGDQQEIVTANLIVDAAGRGSAAPKWLAALGYDPAPVELVTINIGYATRTFRRRPHDLSGANLVMIAAQPPSNKRSGFLFPIEGDRWICTLGGWAGDHPPADEPGYLAFARSLAAPDVYNIISRSEPLTDIQLYKYPASQRRRYEKLQRFPAGYLVLGDAICSFNPVYGQGMTSAALQAAALDQLITEQPKLVGSAELATKYFERAAKVIDIPWQLAVGEDFRFAETVGHKAPGTDLINAYVNKVYETLHYDTTVYAEFLKVMNLMQPPTSLFHSKVLWRVLAGRRPAAVESAMRPTTA